MVFHCKKDIKHYSNAVISAEIQLNAYQEWRGRAAGSDDEFDTLNILEISDDIYYQAIANYNTAIRKLPNRMPAFFMGYHKCALPRPTQASPSHVADAE